MCSLHAHASKQGSAQRAENPDDSDNPARLVNSVGKPKKGSARAKEYMGPPRTIDNRASCHAPREGSLHKSEGGSSSLVFVDSDRVVVHLAGLNVPNNIAGLVPGMSSPLADSAFKRGRVRCRISVARLPATPVTYINL